MGAPLNPVPNVIRVVLQGFVDTSAAHTIWVNVLHFQYAGSTPSSATLTALGTQIGTTWAANVASLCPSPTTLQIVGMTDLSSTTSAEAEVAVLHPGTRGDDSIPANAAVLVSYPSTLRYKGGHPRSYLYVLGNADLTGATSWTSAATAEVQSKWTNFLFGCIGAASGGTSFTNFVSIRYRGKFLPNGGPPHFYLTTPLVNVVNPNAITAHSEIASQRGRVGRRKA